MLSPFASNNRTAEQTRWNKEMSSVRMSVEHGFGEITREWPFLNTWWKQRQRDTRIREGTLSSEWYSTPMTAESQRDTSYSALSMAPLRERRFVVESTVELLELAYRQAPGVLEVIKRDYWS
ncbi:hypothetical protein C8F04DRAFT_1184818 [Mycena alexandri]|uniref:Uncharacterized protein n=1 Tax=Mycena alexandri TaxID=1745969 RepID=A0AAD6WYW6_9AGAR|nr:hypothetical protein C8F04DRAFT_1184818 [Mycena alexandri]